MSVFVYVSFVYSYKETIFASWALFVELILDRYWSHLIEQNRLKNKWKKSRHFFQPFLLVMEFAKQNKLLTSLSDKWIAASNSQKAWNRLEGIRHYRISNEMWRRITKQMRLYLGISQEIGSTQNFFEIYNLAIWRLKALSKKWSRKMVKFNLSQWSADRADLKKMQNVNGQTSTSMEVKIISKFQNKLHF